jgi:hypothetical protein
VQQVSERRAELDKARAQLRAAVDGEGRASSEHQLCWELREERNERVRLQRELAAWRGADERRTRYAREPYGLAPRTTTIWRSGLDWASPVDDASVLDTKFERRTAFGGSGSSSSRRLATTSCAPTSMRWCCPPPPRLLRPQTRRPHNHHRRCRCRCRLRRGSPKPCRPRPPLCRSRRRRRCRRRDRQLVPARVKEPGTSTGQRGPNPDLHTAAAAAAAAAASAAAWRQLWRRAAGAQRRCWQATGSAAPARPASRRWWGPADCAATRRQQQRGGSCELARGGALRVCS